MLERQKSCELFGSCILLEEGSPSVVYSQDAMIRNSSFIRFEKASSERIDVGSRDLSRISWCTSVDIPDYRFSQGLALSPTEPVEHVSRIDHHGSEVRQEDIMISTREQIEM